MSKIINGIKMIEKEEVQEDVQEVQIEEVQDVQEEVKELSEREQALIDLKPLMDVSRKIRPTLTSKERKAIRQILREDGIYLPDLHCWSCVERAINYVRSLY